MRAVARSVRARAAGLVAVSTLAASALAAAPVSQALAAQQSSASVAPAGARAERTVTADTPDATRAELTVLLETEQKRAEDAAAKPADRTRAKEEVATIRRRLEAGDFRAGDRFIALVVADSVRRLEMTVREGPSVDFAPLPQLSLQGLLRSELQPAIRQLFARFYRNPEVRIDFLTRVTVTGAVAKPGVVSVPPDALVGDVLMAAGGPLASANMEKVEILRNGRTFLDRKKFQQATKDGVTLDRLGVRPGDEFKVAERGRRNWAQIGTMSMIGVTALTAILTLIRSSYSD